MALYWPYCICSVIKGCFTSQKHLIAELIEMFYIFGSFLVVVGGGGVGWAVGGGGGGWGGGECTRLIAKVICYLTFIYEQSSIDTKTLSYFLSTANIQWLAPLEP